jgi:hypothetical protein
MKSDKKRWSAETQADREWWEKQRKQPMPSTPTYRKGKLTQKFMDKLGEYIQSLPTGDKGRSKKANHDKYIRQISKDLHKQAQGKN